MTFTPHHKLIRHWADSNAGIRFGATSEEGISALEGRYGVRLPLEFRSYLLEASPEDDQVDHNRTERWSLRRIKNIPDEYEHTPTNAEVARDARSYLFFADFMIWSMAWAICCQPGENYGRIVVVSGSDRFVADSFGTFIEAYVRHCRELL